MSRQRDGQGPPESGAASFALRRIALRRIARLFPAAPDPVPRIGAEAELLVLDAETHEVVPTAARVLPALRSIAAERGWTEATGAKGATRFTTRAGGAVTFEPGGQIEYATPPHRSPRALLADLAGTTRALIECGERHGIMLLGAGIDPFNDAAGAPLQAVSERYCAMDAYFERIGPAGRRMMRQTASVQVNLGAVHDPALEWRVLNAAAPSLIAIFANSLTYAGRATGHASHRAVTWRTLDPCRTGLWYDERDAAGGYADRALRAPFMLAAPGTGPDAWTDAALDAHLSTLFPEVRPRGYYEIRSMDAVPPALYPAAVLLPAALVWDRAALLEASALLGAPDEARLDTAARAGLADPVHARLAVGLVEIAREAVARLGREWCDAADAEAAFGFFDDWTLKGRAPGFSPFPGSSRPGPRSYRSSASA